LTYGPNEGCEMISKSRKAMVVTRKTVPFHPAFHRYCKRNDQQKSLAQISPYTRNLLSNVVRSIHAPRKSRIPAVHNALYHLDASAIKVLYRRSETALVGIEQIVRRRAANPWTIEIGSRAHDDDTAEIDKFVTSGAEQSLENSVVFLCRSAVDAGAVGGESGVVTECFTEETAAVIDI
jgi:hypothetical protein